MWIEELNADLFPIMHVTTYRRVWASIAESTRHGRPCFCVHSGEAVGELLESWPLAGSYINTLDVVSGSAMHPDQLELAVAPELEAPYSKTVVRLAFADQRSLSLWAERLRHPSAFLGAPLNLPRGETARLFEEADSSEQQNAREHAASEMIISLARNSSAATSGDAKAIIEEAIPYHR